MSCALYIHSIHPTSTLLRQPQLITCSFMIHQRPALRQRALHFIFGSVEQQDVDLVLVLEQVAADKLREAVSIEDSFAYMEPPRVYQPVRQCLGYVLLKSGQLEEAEKVINASTTQFAPLPSQLQRMARIACGENSGHCSTHDALSKPTDLVEADLNGQCIKSMKKPGRTHVLGCVCRCIGRIWRCSRTTAGRCKGCRRRCMRQAGMRRWMHCDLHWRLHGGMRTQPSPPAATRSQNRGGHPQAPLEPSFQGIA